MSCEHCKGSCTGCGGCSGCNGAMELSSGEIEMLLTLSQIPFLPVSRALGDDTPIYLEDDRLTPAEYSLILQCLEKRGLISIDYDMPLKGLCCPTYEGRQILGSFALTNKGQQVVELMEFSGIQEY